MQYLDKINNRLIFLRQNATPDFWDSYWSMNNSIQSKLNNTTSTWISECTKKYLSPEAGPILEGGCGTGIHVAALTKNGYNCIGIDYAEHTVQTIKNVAPELDIQKGDVRFLQFSDAYFAGYWSQGVIEHFWDGYDQIANEMTRVIKPNGYLFITFPYMSLMRKLKSKFNLYPIWQHNHMPPAFYQFALNHIQVIRYFESLGFTLVYHKPMLGLRATKEEVPWLNPVLHWLDEYQGKSIILRILKYAISKITTKFSGHMILLVLKKQI